MEDAESVHAQHKPATPFLSSDKVMVFHAGPFPHGSNRAALTKLFGTWKWPARPCQPKSRSPSGLGVIWEVHATERPQFEVYQLQHADVLITEVVRRETKPRVAFEVQGSAKTLAALTKKPEKENADPWLQADPWGQYQGPVKQPKTDGMRQVDLDAIASKVAMKMQDQKPQHVHMDEDDTPMADSRFTGLEDRITALEHNLQVQQASQQAHHKDVAEQIMTIQRQVDSQGSALQQHLDHKMDEQLAHIERLLGSRDDRDASKKSRYE